MKRLFTGHYDFAQPISWENIMATTSTTVTNSLSPASHPLNGSTPPSGMPQSAGQNHSPGANTAQDQIDQQYQTVLGRHADPAGLEYFLKALQAGSMDIKALTEALKNSVEGRQHGQPGKGGPAEQDQSAGNHSGDHSPAPDSSNASDPDAAAVDQQYQSVLGRHADSEGLGYFLKALKAGAMDIKALTEALKNSVEGQQHNHPGGPGGGNQGGGGQHGPDRQAPDHQTRTETPSGEEKAPETVVTSKLKTQIDQQYQDVLGRHADPVGEAYFLKILIAESMDIAALTDALVHSVEGQMRAHRSPAPDDHTQTTSNPSDHPTQIVGVHQSQSFDTYF